MVDNSKPKTQKIGMVCYFDWIDTLVHYQINNLPIL